jgi:NAD dependent epimerase/dehydratase
MILDGKKVLVTGGEGFIGSHLVETLLEKGCNVKAMVLYNFANSWGWLDTFLEKTKKSFEVTPGDVRDRDLVKRAMEGVDVVFHLAALISIPYSYRSPYSFIETNVVGTFNVLQCALDEGVEKVLITSTSEVYGTALYTPIDEMHPLQAQSPYSASKIAADKIAESFHAAYGLPLAVVRPFNTYGPRQSARAIIPTIITQLLSGAKEVTLGNLNPTRDLLFVKDTVAGFIAIAESDAVSGEQINIATQLEVSIGKLAHLIIERINPDAGIVQEQARIRPDKSEVTRLLGSNKKLRELTDWKPLYSLERGLQETIDWFKQKDILHLYKSDIYNY